jgi:H/ACA ribonucleoprotein complex subunit 3
MEVYVAGKRLHVDPAQSIGKGGEADVYAVSGGRALKLFKPPDHPDFAGLPVEQATAGQRIRVHQQKLPNFPRNLPARVVVPEQLAFSRANPKSEIVGYTMRLLPNMEVLFRYANRTFRESGGIGNQAVVEILRDLHATVEGLHRSAITIGDFNDLNVLVSPMNEAYLIDADSFQFGSFACPMYTAKFVDPLLCDPKETSPALVRKHTPESDWYAYAIMLMQCLLYVGPYGGVYRPKDKRKQVPTDARALRRITIFDPEVIYPKSALRYDLLPDELLDRFTRIFKKDERGVFPLNLLQAMRWTRCTNCKTEHARTVCPHCQKPAPAAVKLTVTVRGNVTAERIFRTDGVIIEAAYQGGQLKWLAHQNGRFTREDASIVFLGPLSSGVRYRISGDETLFGIAGRVTIVPKQGTPHSSTVELRGTTTMFDANASHWFASRGGEVVTAGKYGDEVVGSVLAGQTMLFAGPAFGLGLYRAGNLSVTFTFTEKARSLNDNIKLPPLAGQLVEAHCAFTKDRVWFFVAMQSGGQTINYCFVIHSDATLQAMSSTVAGDGSWLGILPAGAAAVGDKLLVPTDDGIVQMAASGGTIAQTKQFPDTEPFVDASSRLFAGSQGLYVVSRQDIKKLTVS